MGFTGRLPFVNRLPPFKWLYTGLLCSMPILFVTLEFEYDASFLSLVGATVSFVSGRELLMDVLDLKGDSESGLVTLPLLIGRQTSEILAFGFVFLGCLMVTPVVLVLGSAYSLMIWIGIASIAVPIACLWYGRRSPKGLILALWLPMILGASLFMV